MQMLVSAMSWGASFKAVRSCRACLYNSTPGSMRTRSQLLSARRMYVAANFFSHSRFCSGSYLLCCWAKRNRMGLDVSAKPLHTHHSRARLTNLAVFRITFVNYTSNVQVFPRNFKLVENVIIVLISACRSCQPVTGRLR